MSHTTETNIVICKNLESDATVNLMEKIREARGALEMKIHLGLMEPGEYVISRKGLKGNQAVNWTTTRIWGHTFKSAVQANALQSPQWSGDHLSLWVNRTDKLPVFNTTKGNERYYLALSTATDGLFSSIG